MALLRGTVSEFDEAAGIGWITASDGTRYLLQCTQIADGSRTIAPGTRVVFRAWPRYGRDEACDVEAV